MKVKQIGRIILFGICLAVVFQQCDADAKSNTSAAQSVTAAGAKQNLSFEKAVGNRPAGWRTQTYGGSAEFKYTTGGRSGKRSVMITSQSGADAEIGRAHV